MEHQEILNLLKEARGFKFVTRKWNVVKDQTNKNYDFGNQNIYNTEILKCIVCDYIDAYILVKGYITIIGCNLAAEVAFKNCVRFIICITKIDRSTIDNAEDLDFVMTM